MHEVEEPPHEIAAHDGNERENRRVHQVFMCRDVKPHPRHDETICGVRDSEPDCGSETRFQQAVSSFLHDGNPQ